MSTRALSIEIDWHGLRPVCIAAARRAGLSDSLAEDATQNTLLRLWRFRHRLRPGADVRPLAAVIARRESLRLLADRHSRTDAALEEASFVAAPIESREDLLDLRAAIETLEPIEQVMLGLRYAGDLTQPRIAAMLGVPEGTAKIRLHRARAKLRTILENHGS
jgi:RNA polymerase sigma-70 factor, ECF subfamily